MEEHWKLKSRRRAYLMAGAALIAVVGAGALVAASVPTKFQTGDTLSADSLNGNFSALDQRLTALEATLLPPGTIIAFGGPAGASADGGVPAVPAGWLLCDGSAISRTTYATLFAAIGINFGGGDGIGTFNLPDLRGRFVRGADHGAGRDPNAATRTASNPGGPVGDNVGTLQGDGFASHQHPLTDPAHSHGSGEIGFMKWACTARADLGFAPGGQYLGLGTCAPNSSGLVNGSVTATSTTGITEGNTGGAETRSKNVAVNYLIKL